jgi:hypothetical protein
MTGNTGQLLLHVQQAVAMESDGRWWWLRVRRNANGLIRIKRFGTSRYHNQIKMTAHIETGSKGTVTHPCCAKIIGAVAIMRIHVVATVLAATVSCGTAAATWRTSAPDPACLEKDVATGIVGMWDNRYSGSLLDMTGATIDGPCDWKLSERAPLLIYSIRVAVPPFT